jgi:hypothetical protein
MIKNRCEIVECRGCSYQGNNLEYPNFNCRNTGINNSSIYINESIKFIVLLGIVVFVAVIIW